MEEIYIEKGNGVMIRSRGKLLDSNEKCTSYFLNLEKRNANVKYIKTLYNEHGDEINCPNDILKEEELFYKKLYAATHTEVHPPKNCSFMNIQNTLCNEDKDCCDKDVTLHELGTNLKQLSNNKAPGCDGFTADFYKFFWKDLKHFLFDSLLYSFNTGKLSLDQRRAILCLLPKPNKDLRYLKNWRPLSMLNTDYKILAKTLATRLQSVIGKLISNDQSGYIKGRFIGENIRTVIDVLQYSRDINIKGYITFLDFEKAFDSVSWNFLFTLLERYNFGSKFIKWVKILYTDPLLCVSNNGYNSEFFSISRGVRQGCPISALLFLLVVEAMADSIRQSECVHGITINDHTVSLSQLADDMTLFVKDKESLCHALKILSHFSKCAGLKLNKDKSEIIVLDNVEPAKHVCGIAVATKPIKVLGIWITKDVEEIISLNLNERLEKLKLLLNMWSQRYLTLKGKVTIVNTLALSQIMYTCSVLYTPLYFIDEVNNLIKSFMWPKKVHVKHSTVIAPICEGGLSLPDFRCKIKACKVMWIQRVIKSNR